MNEILAAIQALNTKFDQRITALDKQVGALSQSVTALDTKLDQRTESLDKKIGQRITPLENKVDKVLGVLTDGHLDLDRNVQELRTDVAEIKEKLNDAVIVKAAQ